MANEKTLEILKEIKADPKAKELFKGMLLMRRLLRNWDMGLLPRTSVRP